MPELPAGEDAYFTLLRKHGEIIKDVPFRVMMRE